MTEKAILPVGTYPRIQVNKLGDIILSISKQNGLTTGILIGKTSKSKLTWDIGTKFTDWEVFGELEDYEGPVTITLENSKI